MAETAYFKGEGGSVFAMDLPLGEVYQDKLNRGRLHRVNADGSPYVGPAEPDAEGEAAAPPQSAPKASWIEYAVARGIDPDEAEAMTKQDLIDLTSE